jgi:hypothetical protein
MLGARLKIVVVTRRIRMAVRYGLSLDELEPMPVGVDDPGRREGEGELECKAKIVEYPSYVDCDHYPFFLFSPFDVGVLEVCMGSMKRVTEGC